VYRFPIAACCVVNRSGGVEGGALVARTQRGLRRPRFACLPLSDRCSPLPEPDDDPTTAARVVCALDDLARRDGVRAAVPGPVAWHPSAHVAARYRAHEIPLGPDVAQVLRRVDPEPLAAGLAAGDALTVERRTDAAALAAFRALLVSTRRRGDGPVPPSRLIDGLAYLFDRGLGFVLLARRGERLVGGAVFLGFNRTVRLQFAAGRPRVSGLDAQHLLMLEGIRWGCEAGMRALDLGCIGFDREDLRRFRRAWGAEERLLEVITFDAATPAPRGLS
jgi:Acetyltransferase (GNAT) domain